MRFYLSNEDLAALRIGIAEQERQRLDRERIREDFARRLNREPVDDARVVLARELDAGDTLLDCEWGRNFYTYARVTGVDPSREGMRDGDVWVEFEDIEHGSAGGTTLKRHAPVLIAR